MAAAAADTRLTKLKLSSLNRRLHDLDLVMAEIYGNNGPDRVRLPNNIVCPTIFSQLFFLLLYVQLSESDGWKNLLRQRMLIEKIIAGDLLDQLDDSGAMQKRYFYHSYVVIYS